MTTDKSARKLEQDSYLTKADISELGLNKAPTDIGRSWEEIEQQNKDGEPHGK